MPSPFKFKAMGSSGIEVSEVFPKIGEHVDDMAIIRSMYTDIPAHEVATVMMNTGSLRLAKPCMGSWAVYGLGTENQNMPGFISLRPGGGLPPGGTQNWQSAFLPGVYQGTSINTQAPSVEEMIQNIKNPYISLKEQRRQLDLVHQLNELHSQNLQKDAQLEARIEAYEIAFKMQIGSDGCFRFQQRAARISKRFTATRTQGTAVVDRPAIAGAGRSLRAGVGRRLGSSQRYRGDVAGAASANRSAARRLS